MQITRRHVGPPPPNEWAYTPSAFARSKTVWLSLTRDTTHWLGLKNNLSTAPHMEFFPITDFPLYTDRINIYFYSVVELAPVVPLCGEGQT